MKFNLMIVGSHIADPDLFEVALNHAWLSNALLAFVTVEAVIGALEEPLTPDEKRLLEIVLAAREQGISELLFLVEERSER